MIKKIFFILLTLILLTACYRKIKIPLPHYESELFIVGLVEPDSVAQISLSRTIPLSERSTDYTVNDARVILYEDESAVDTLKQNLSTPYLYTGTYPVNDHSEYKLRVSHNHLNAEGVARIPSAPDVEIKSVSQEEVITEENITNAVKIKIIIHDPPQTENYYAMRVMKKGGPEESQLYWIYTSLNDPAVMNEGIRFSDYIVFSDIIFDGKDYTMTLYFDLPGELLPGEYLEFKICALERHAYLWMRYQPNSSGLEGPFAGETSQIPDNIKDGLGVFAAKNAVILPYHFSN